MGDAGLVVIGLIGALLSAFFNGTFAGVMKIPSVARVDLDPIVFLLYFSLGVFTSSWLVLPFTKLAYDQNLETAKFSGSPWVVTYEDGYFGLLFTPLGLLSGALLVLAVTGSFVAVPKIGLSVGQGVWGGVAIVMSFVAGVMPFVPGHNVVSSIAGVVGALVLLLLGVLGIAFHPQLGALLHGPLAPLCTKLCGGCCTRRCKAYCSPLCGVVVVVDAAGSGSGSGSGGGDDDEEAADGAVVAPKLDASAPLLAGSDVKGAATTLAAGGAQSSSDGGGGGGSGGGRSAAASCLNLITGFIAACTTGIFGGICLLPMSFADDKFQNLAFLPSFGIGVILTAPLVALVYFGIIRRCTRPEWHWRVALLPGMLSGLIWNLSNVSSIFGIIGLGFSVAYPLMQCALFFAGLWGVFLFKESKGLAVVIFFVSGAVLLAGAILLTLSVGKA